MSFLEYPKYKYHSSKDAVIVNNATEEINLGNDWFDSQYAANNPNPLVKNIAEEIIEEKTPKKKTSKK